MRLIASKIYPRKELAEILDQFRKKGKKIGVTNGTFDLLHSGHVEYLEKAKKACDILVVSINTDASVKKYKDSNRPIISEHDRATIIAALESVDYVTFHNEKRMRNTLKAFKPHYYIKAADYDNASLTSKNVLNQWKGEVLFIPLVEGKSTTIIIGKILNAYGEKPISLEIKNHSKTKNKAIILDRDGVINEEIEYLHEPAKFKFIKKALKGIKQMQDMGYKIVIVTTQAGIGLGYFTKEDYYKVNKVMLKGFHDYGIIVSKTYFCPHNISDNCSCRKPKTGLIELAEKDLNLDIKRSWIIGDKTSDILAGKNMGSKTMLVKSGHKGMDKEYNVIPDFISTDLINAAKIIKSVDLRKKHNK